MKHHHFHCSEQADTACDQADALDNAALGSISAYSQRLPSAWMLHRPRILPCEYLLIMCAPSSAQADALDKAALGSINAYSPGLSGAWMLQRAMSLRVGQRQDPQFINKLLGNNFGSMQRLGDGVLMPFLQVGAPVRS